MREPMTPSHEPDDDRVVVVGAGFAGLRVARKLQTETDVTLLAPTDQFEYLPMVHEVLSETSNPGTVTRDLDETLDDVNRVYGRAERVEDDVLVTADGDEIPFDKLAVAIGAEVNTFGTPGVREHALPFYSLGDALHANARIKQAAAEADGDPVRVTVVGASFTGVEVAGEVAELVDKLDVDREVTLLEAMDGIFQQQSEDFREGVHDGLDDLDLGLELEAMVSEVGPETVTFDQNGDTREIESDVTFWCAGVKPRTIDGVSQTVDAHLRSEDRDDVYVAGDAANFDNGVPKLAQTAERQADVVAHNVLNPDDPKAYEPDVKGLIVAIGEKYAVAELDKGPVFTGRVPWHIKRNLYKAKMKLL